MKETKLTQSMLDVIQANNGLKVYLNGLSVGRDFTPRSNLYNLEGKTQVKEADEVLNDWVLHLATLKTGNLFEQRVYQFDISQAEKWGPQGGIAPYSDLAADVVYPTFEHHAYSAVFSSAEWWNAKESASKFLIASGVHGLRPAAYHNVVDDMRARDTLESNSGWPDFTRRSKPEVVEAAIRAAENGDWKRYPAIALFRNYRQKTRLVWMYPLAVNLVEGSFFQPLQSAIMRSQILRNTFFAPWQGFEAVRRYVTKQYEGDRECFLAASDFSATDEHFRLEATMQVFDVLQYCFAPAYRKALLESMVRMHTIPLLVSADTMLEGEHGVSSGSNWTNFVETIFDYIFSIYVSMKLQSRTGSVSYRGLYAIGDDMAWVSGTYDKHFASTLQELGAGVGQIIKEDKTMNERDYVKSLQRLFQRGYCRPDGEVRAVYSTIRALNSLVYPERFHSPKVWTKDNEVIRAFMILENCVDHPLFRPFCAYVAKGDPYMLEFAKKSSKYMDLKLRSSRNLPGLNATYNQEKRDQRLADFQSVRFIRSLT